MGESLSQIFVTGNVGRDPESKLVGGKKVTSFTVANNKSRKLPDGTWAKTTTWFSVDCWGENAPFGLEKGVAVSVSGEFEVARKDGKAIIQTSGDPLLKVRTSSPQVVVHRKGDRAASGSSSEDAPVPTSPGASPDAPAGYDPSDDLPF
jgi:single-stranded DNA-binding protein